jgi:hypothetical protein
MLTKKYCQACDVWTKRDEEDWEKGMVVCNYGGKYVKIEEAAPNECPYKLEQILEEKSNE